DDHVVAARRRTGPVVFRFPDARQIGLAVERTRRWRGKIDGAALRARYVRGRVPHPLRAEREGRHETNRNHEGTRSTTTHEAIMYNKRLHVASISLCLRRFLSLSKDL